MKDLETICYYIATLSPLKSWETIFIFHPDFWGAMKVQESLESPKMQYF